MTTPAAQALIERLCFVRDAIKPIKGLQGMDATVQEAIAALTPQAGGDAVEIENAADLECHAAYGILTLVTADEYESRQRRAAAIAALRHEAASG